MTAQLEELLATGQYEEALGQIDAALEQARGVNNADKGKELQRAKAVLLVLEESFEAALEACREFEATDVLLFERAYAKYRLGRYEGALHLLQPASEAGHSDDKRLNTLLAQVVSRLIA